VRLIAPVFEKSPWIAEAAWSRRPFESPDSLHRALREIVAGANEEKQLALICAHPDLVGNATLSGSLTRESTIEQSAAGLNRLTPKEIQLFQDQNQAYRKKFGFPFVICARLNKKQAIVEGFTRRLGNSREHEIATALEEIYKIAYLRLSDILQGCPLD
jgi:OHCU decarboxylase